METIRWEVDFLSPPRAVRPCKKCGAKSEFYSSGMFRINARQKLLCVWLIYRCATCETTWNLPIFSRTSPAGIGRELLDRFFENDCGLALKYAMDAGLLKKNGAVLMPSDYCIIGDEVDITKAVRLEITTKYQSGLKVAQVIREKLSLSRGDFEKLAVRGWFRMENKADITRCKLCRGAVVLIGGDLDSSNKH